MKAILIALLLSALVGTGCSKEEKVAATGAPITTAAAETRSAAAGGTAPQLQGAPTQTLPDFAAIVEANKGAVVNITSTMRRTAMQQPQQQSPFGQGQGDDDEDNPLNQFFRRFQQPMPQIPQQGMG